MVMESRLIEECASDFCVVVVLHSRKGPQRAYDDVHAEEITLSTSIRPVTERTLGNDTTLRMREAKSPYLDGPLGANIRIQLLDGQQRTLAVEERENIVHLMACC